MACLLHAIPFYLCPYPAKYGNTAYSICRWKHQNPKHCRLVLQTINKSTKVEGIAIRSIDGIKNGRGVGFSWFNGYLVAAGIHEIEFEFYTYRKFHSHSMKDPIYTKNITMDFLPDAVYNVEARADCRKFRISRVMGWNR